MRALIALRASLTVAAIAIPALSHAQDRWPDRPIHIIVPLPAGSATDVVARLLGKALTQKLGATIIVDNRDGASGVIGTAQIAQAAPDGYTIGIATTTTIITAPILNKHTPYDVTKDFTSIAMLGYSPSSQAPPGL
jgi:tripartite-type tricarboxylate transporter receptor subunit TctC